MFYSVIKGDASDNPVDLSNWITSAQEKVVELNLVEATGFTLNLAIGWAPPDIDASSFFMAGAISFLEFTTTVVVVHEPSSISALVLAAYFFLTRSVRRS